MSAPIQSGSECMATLSIRNLPDEDHEALRLRAAHHGVSMGAEARRFCIVLCAMLPKQVRSGGPTGIPCGQGQNAGDLVIPDR